MRRLFSILLLYLALVTIVSAQSFRPVPHEFYQEGKKSLNVSKGVALIDPKCAFSDDCGFLKARTKGTFLSIDFGPAVSNPAGVKSVPGAYKLTVTPKGIIIIGYDEQGAFWGLQTLRRLVEESDDMRIPCCTIKDWPDNDTRGMADCSYDGRWSQDFRLSVICLAGSLKMNEYVYAPEDDPYVCGPDWYMPYTQGAADSLKVLVDACRSNRMAFTWCIRPNEEFSWSESDYGLLLGKFEMMHFLGVRSFGILFDDVPYSDGFETRKQEFIDRLNSEFVSRKKDVNPLLSALDGYYNAGSRLESLKLGLYGFADRGWNSEDYDPVASLEWAAGKIAPDVAEAYVRYAIDSEVATDGFGMDESADVELIGIKGYGQDSYDRLMERFVAMEKVPELMSSAADTALYEDLKPWISEFGNLAARCRRILECIEFFNAGDIPGFWSTYASNLMSDDDMKAFQAHPSGKAVLYPYYERMMKELADAFDASYKDQVEYTLIPGDGIQTYMAPDEASVCHLVLDNPHRREVVVRLSDAQGMFTAEFCIADSYLEFEMKGDAVKVEVIGDVPVFETVFVK